MGRRTLQRYVAFKVSKEANRVCLWGLESVNGVFEHLEQLLRIFAVTPKKSLIRSIGYSCTNS